MRKGKHIIFAILALSFVFVLQFTTSKFEGNQVYSTVTFNGDSYTSSKATI